MTIEDSHAVANVAEQVFRSCLPPTWLVREQNPDVHVDFVVEIVEARAPTGKRFAIQLKGRSGDPIGLRGEQVSQRVPVKHLCYYLERCREPVFLVVVDVERRSAHYVFVQELVKSQLRGDAWTRRKGKSIRVPLRNRLDDIPGLTRDVDRALKYMQDQYPGTVRAAARRERVDLEALDPRFVIDIALANEKVTYTITPKKSVETTLAIRTESAAARLREAIESGCPVELEPGSVQLRGSPLFDRLAAEVTGPVRFEIEPRRNCLVSIGFRESPGEERIVVPPSDALVRLGVKRGSIEWSLPRAPLRFQTEFDYSQRPRSTGKFDLRFAYERWIGADLLTAPHFDRLRELFAAARGGAQLVVIVEHEGNLLFKWALNPEGDGSLASIADFLDALHLAREAARSLDITPTVPPLDAIDLDEVEVLHRLGVDRKVTVPVRALSVTVAAVDARRITSSLDEDGRLRGPIRVTTPLALFGATSRTWCLARDICPTRLHPDSLRRLREGELPTDLEIVGEPDTRISYSLLSAIRHIEATRVN